MSDEPRRTFVGVLPSGYADTFVDGIDPVGAMIADAIRKADLAKAEVERQRLAQVADAERMRNTRRARAARRFKRAFKAFARLK